MPERRAKFERMMRALAAGWRDGARIIHGMPPWDTNPIAIYGQVMGSEKLLVESTKRRRPYWHIDNGYWDPGRGRSDGGYYRMNWCGMTPRFLNDAGTERARKLNVEMKPWRSTGKHVLIALPGVEFGRGIGLNMNEWIARVQKELPRYTDRPILVRQRTGAGPPLEYHLQNCWALVTHSSNAAVDAVTAGIPVFVEPTAPAAPVGNLKWDDLECPRMPDREQWFNSLACQQFSLAEMANGTAYDYLMAVRQLAA